MASVQDSQRIEYTPLQQQQLAYSSKLHRYGMGVYGFLMLFNFVFYVALFSTTSLPYVFPINDILPSFYDISSVPVIIIFALDCFILICCIFAELKLTEMTIDCKAFINRTFFYLFLNLFYIFLTPILLFTVVRSLSTSNCFAFKCKLNEFLETGTSYAPVCSSDEDEDDADDEQKDDASKTCVRTEVQTLLHSKDVDNVDDSKHTTRDAKDETTEQQQAEAEEEEEESGRVSLLAGC
mmetsp:Transcript_27700/g.45673  ORF Transcript_27700/g.45673 Transcript_27700/m.45673 type:complete len:238 (-) Transcript_27700:1092-1805(-)